MADIRDFTNSSASGNVHRKRVVVVTAKRVSTSFCQIREYTDAEYSCSRFMTSWLERVGLLDGRGEAVEAIGDIVWYYSK